MVLRCVVVGGGPGGMVLAYLLGQAGVAVCLLESHRDFDRDFRGDSLHPYTLELLDELGLGDALLTLGHHPARQFRFHTPAASVTVADYARLPTRRNYVALMPQAQFLDFLAGRARQLPGCEIRTGAKVTGLLHDGAGTVRGVQYTDAADGGRHELTADLVVGADGRFSKIRQLAGIPARSLGASTDLLWFRLPRVPTDPPDADAELYFGRDHYVGVLGGVTDWQVGYTLPKGDYAAARDRGVEPIRAFIARHVPWLADRVHMLTDFRQTTLLSVEISRVQTWHRPGLLLIGDAAHVISPVGGNGILMAIQDAVAAANVLVPALRPIDPPANGANNVEAALEHVQRMRAPAIEQVQRAQVRLEQRTARARAAGRSIAPPGRLLKIVTALPVVRTRNARANAYGPRPPKLSTAVLRCAENGKNTYG
ncbi:FAD-dependent oxidoreductase [Dactylosporangium darangshiense]|uniref:FAD-dependent oxidoreductase n=1 Tax=Dactylosporangium darangshiense TaxID=579108 RepID=A0ABP8DNF1_9ACTN